MQANQRLALRELDLSQNNIEDRGVTALSNWLSKMRDGIVRLRLAECGAGRQGLALLLTTLENHHYHASTVREVDLSHNRAGEETNRSLQSFLRKASVLECLRLANMSITRRRGVHARRAGVVVLPRAAHARPLGQPAAGPHRRDAQLCHVPQRGAAARRAVARQHRPLGRHAGRARVAHARARSCST
jgi:hypothetical protein